MKTIDLAGKWSLRSKNGKVSVPAVIPGETHSALLAAKKIEDPYWADHETGLQWIGREDWSFERTFTVPKKLLAEKSVYLHCDSLDTLATVYINGKKAGRSENMFVRRRFEIKKFLRPGANTVRIDFASAENEAAARAKKLPYPIPHNVMVVQSMHRNLIRKSQCHSGWDWGPCLMVAGIYGEIYIGATSLGRIGYVHTQQKHARNEVELEVIAEVLSPAGGSTALQIEIDGQKISKPVRLAAGLNTLRHKVRIKNPRLWWPNGIGAQPLYRLTVRVAGEEIRKRIGLRTVRLENKKDELGASMTLFVNEQPIFCKGANWVPTDALPSRQSRAVLENLIASAVAANMNMLRVWGGGIYEQDDFYDLCDENGILVWQDFMFACALYPATLEFLESVREEAVHQVKRLRDHPSLALWCGNNENIGALRWYKESIENRDLYVTEYDRLNEGVLGRTVRELDPTRPWWPSSPCGGPGDYSNCWDFDGRGDMHYWNVWFNPVPLEKYLEIKPRFHSEFGFQGYPSLEIIASFAPREQWNPTAPLVEFHERGGFGAQRMLETFTRYFRFPDTGFENIIYLSQVQQSIAMKIGVEYWRRLRPVCMGALYWQLNDNWPVVSSSSLEYSGKWKLAHHAAKRFFAPQLISIAQHGDRIEIWGSNDRLEPVAGPVRLRIIGLDGKVLKTLRFIARVPKASSVVLKKVALADLIADPATGFLVVEWKIKGAKIYNEHVFVPYKKLDLPRARIRKTVRATAPGFEVTLETDRPALWVQVDAKGIAGEFDDNGFALLPGKPRRLRFVPAKKTSRAEFEQSLATRHLRETYP